jgi:hypothetical protein
MSGASNPAADAAHVALISKREEPPAKAGDCLLAKANELGSVKAKRQRCAFA